MVSPKIILNEDYLDLRKCPESIINSRRSNTGTYATCQRDSSLVNNLNLKSDGLRLEKELINCGLKKLASSYNATAGHTSIQKQVVNKKKKQEKEKTNKFDPRFRRFLVAQEKSGLKSLSEVSVTPKKVVETFTTSTPLFPREKTSNIDVEKQKQEIYKNKFTMTKTGSSQEQNLRLRQLESRLKHQGPMTATYAKEINTGYSPLHKEYIVNQQIVDPRLCEKYSVLKMPWKRTWTIPVFSHKSAAMLNNYKNTDHTDRQTYLYDDGTEIDSTYVEEKQKQIFSNVFQSQFMGLLFLGGAICGILLVSLLIWFIFGFDFIHVFFKPREVQDVTLRRYIKYIGGSAIYLLTSLFKTLGRVLSTPTYQVYQAPPDRYRWPPMHRHPVPAE